MQFLRQRHELPCGGFPDGISGLRREACEYLAWRFCRLESAVFGEDEVRFQGDVETGEKRGLNHRESKEKPLHPYSPALP
jgi:hypothetical protein